MNPTEANTERHDAIVALARAQAAAEDDDPERALANAEAAVALLRVHKREWNAKQQAPTHRR